MTKAKLEAAKQAEFVNTTPHGEKKGELTGGTVTLPACILICYDGRPFRRNGCWL